MGAVERDIDWYADEEGKRQEREDRAEQWFIDERENLANRLASGADVKVNESLTLDFDSVMDNLYHRDEQLKAAFKLCMVNSGIGGLHLKRMVTEIAQEVIDEASGELRTEMEKEYEH